MSNRTDSQKDGRLFIRLSINQFIHLKSGNNGKEKENLVRFIRLPEGRRG